MKRLFSITLILILILNVFAGCEKSERLEIITPDKTILVYMAGDNSLSSYTLSNLSLIIEGAGSGNIDECNLLVYIDSRSNLPPSLYKIEANDRGVVDSVLVKTYPSDQNSVDKTIMYSIITDVFSQYPTEENGLFLWSHGSAWLPSNLSAFRAFGQDDSNWMEINDLRDALPEGLDYIIFDACYMASIEVAFALRDKSDYIIGSSTEVMGDGFPYQQTIPALLAKGSLEERLKAVAEGFYNHYNAQSGFERTGNISLIKTAGLDDFAASCRPFLSGRYVDEQMIDPSQYGLNLQALEYMTTPVSYSYLYDFTDYMSLFDTQSQINTGSVVLYKETTATAYFEVPGRMMDINTYSGLSIYVPQVRNPQMNEWYKQLDWYKAVYE